MSSVETTSLSKTFHSTFRNQKVEALKELSLKVEPGTIFGLLGPNGAGKTTLIKILLGITFPSSGSAKILNEDISNYKIKSRVGYLPENHKYPYYLTGEQVLSYLGSLSGADGRDLNKRIDYLLDLVQLSKWRRTKIKAYSKGMMQRLGLAQALINDPELIFLDEPTDGVDPIGRKDIRDTLQHLKDQGKTIFLNSHLLSEVELITDRVAILHKGVLLREGNVKELTEKKLEYQFSVEGGINEELKSLLTPSYSVKFNHEESFIVRVNDTEELNRLIDSVRQHGMNINGIIPQRETLEDLFISLIRGQKEQK